MEQTIREIYEAGTVVGRSGKTHPLLSSAIDPEEGQFIFDLIHDDPGITKTLEVGCCYGLSSLHICHALQGRGGAHHWMIDPFQNTMWDGAGTKNLEDAGIDFFELIEDKSEFALPRLLEANEGELDFILIDGWHTFDHTLVDSFYASRLLRVGGWLVIDDVSWPSVRRVVDFLKNYPCYAECGSVSKKMPKSWKRTAARVLASPLDRATWEKVLAPTLCRRVFDDRRVRMIALKKAREDDRNWDWHVDTF